MEEILLKFEKLDSFRKQELLDFLEFLLNKQAEPAEARSYSTYKKRILEVSAWSDEEIDVFEENRKKFSQWQALEW
ncbi:MAG: hypothetical protein KDD09_27065, partial [Phaeodactylibacter sp.]|nr:hypothetical protein [Phaeodactylibacter sp.]